MITLLCIGLECDATPNYCLDRVGLLSTSCSELERESSSHKDDPSSGHFTDCMVEDWCN